MTLRWHWMPDDPGESMVMSYPIHDSRRETVTDDLAAWLRECIDEDERVAREVSAVKLAGAIVPGTNGAIGPRWDAKDGMVFGEGITWGGAAEGFRGTLLWDARDRRNTSSFAAIHMARWDPARVLAECDAKRRMVELHIRQDNGPDQADSCWTCEGEDWPCPTLRLLAEPYRIEGRLGYREDWRP